MLYSWTDTESYVTEYTLVYEDKNPLVARCVATPSRSSPRPQCHSQGYKSGPLFQQWTTVEPSLDPFWIGYGNGHVSP